MEWWAGIEPAPQGFADLRIRLFATITLVDPSGLEPEMRGSKPLVLPITPRANLAEAEGFEPIGAVTPAGFQDQCIKPDSAKLPK